MRPKAAPINLLMSLSPGLYVMYMMQRNDLVQTVHVMKAYGNETELIFQSVFNIFDI